MITRFILILFGLILLTAGVKKRNALIPVIGFILIVVGELLARVIFYGLHMTVGMAALGY